MLLLHRLVLLQHPQSPFPLPLLEAKCWGIRFWERPIRFVGLRIRSHPNPLFWFSVSTLLPALPQAEPRDSRGSCRSPRLTTHSQKERQEKEPVGGSKAPHGVGDAAGHHSPRAGGMWRSVQPSKGGSLRWVVAGGRRG